MVELMGLSRQLTPEYTRLPTVKNLFRNQTRLEIHGNAISMRVFNVFLMGQSWN